jgi:hypothetical protein
MRLLTRMMLVVAIALPVCAHADDLESAVKRDKPERIRSAIAAGGDIHKRYSRNQTLLHIAAERGNLQAAQLLVAAGADMNAQDSNGETPMHVAVTYGRLAVLKFLLAQGADYRIRNKANRDLSSHAERAVNEQYGLPSSGGTNLQTISRYLANTIPKLPPPRSSGIVTNTSPGAPEKSPWGEADPDDTITVNLAKYNLAPDKARAAARLALGKDGWMLLASESGREVGSYYHRNRDAEYRVEILFQGNVARISYLRNFDHRRDKLLKRIEKNFDRELKSMSGAR